MNRNFFYIIFLLVIFDSCKKTNNDHTNDSSKKNDNFEMIQGAIVRGDPIKKEIALVFTGHEFADGGLHITDVLNDNNVKASFFFTGDFYRNQDFSKLIFKLKNDGNYLGAHSNKHLLYCDWKKRDSLLITKSAFEQDLLLNYDEMKKFGIEKKDAPFYLPPFEWFNDSISKWTKDLNLVLVNMSYGTLSHADYTLPSAINYRSSKTIYESILSYEKKETNGLNGFILLAHIGVSPERSDKFYKLLHPLISELKKRDYTFKRIDSLLN